MYVVHTSKAEGSQFSSCVQHHKPYVLHYVCKYVYGYVCVVCERAFVVEYSTTSSMCFIMYVNMLLAFSKKMRASFLLFNRFPALNYFENASRACRYKYHVPFVPTGCICICLHVFIYVYVHLRTYVYRWLVVVSITSHLCLCVRACMCVHACMLARVCKYN